MLERPAALTHDRVVLGNARQTWRFDRRNATVICGNTLGEYCLIGAGAVVTKDVPNYGLVYGNPGRLMGWACFRERLDMGIDPDIDETCTCTECGRAYRKAGLTVTVQTQTADS